MILSWGSEMPENDFVIGTVKWFDGSKGYGFLVCEGKDIFVHSKRLRESGFASSKDDVKINLYPGEKLRFRILQGPKGPYAVELSRVK
jgi:CspA family cold shock protein